MEFGREFHADLFWNWAINDVLLLEGEALSAPCYTVLKLPAKRHYLPYASFEAVGGFCVEKKVLWRHDLPRELTTHLKRKADFGETCTITTNLLVTENGCDSVCYARISRRQAGCGMGEVTTWPRCYESLDAVGRGTKGRAYS